MERMSNKKEGKVGEKHAEKDANEAFCMGSVGIKKKYLKHSQT